MSAEENPAEGDGRDGVIRPIRYVPTRDTVDTRPWHVRHRGRVVTGAVFAGIALVFWFIFTAKSVRILTDPDVASVDVHGGFAFTIGSVHVLRAGDYRVTASAEGYRPFEAPFTEPGEGG